MITLARVCKKFEDKEAVENVNLSVNKGSIYGLLGSNGAGKTTLLKLLAGIYQQDSGTVTIDEQPVFENTSIKNRVFFIPDYPYFFSHYTIKQKGQFYKNMYSGWNEQRFQQLVTAFDIEDRKRVV